MPFYEYQCQACGAQVEVMQKITDAPLKKCPECGKSRLAKLVSAPVFRLKGGGWYETDFKSDKENKRNLVESEKPDAPAVKPEAKAEPAADSKPEKKVEAAPAARPVRASKPRAPARTARPSKKPAAKRKAGK